MAEPRPGERRVIVPIGGGPPVVAECIRLSERRGRVYVHWRNASGLVLCRGSRLFAVDGGPLGGRRHLGSWLRGRPA